jgi:TrkA domain protein
MSNVTAIPIREATLPGIGKKYTMPLRAGGNLAIVVKPDGDRQLYHFQQNEDRPCDVITVDKQESQQIANLMGSAVVSAPEKLELALGGLEVEWLELSATSRFVGKTLAESELRRRTGASVIAILRGTKAIANPDIHERFEARDTVMLIGSPAQTEAARTYLVG